MQALLITLLLSALAIAFVIWVVRSMLEKACPVCTERGETGMLVPAIPGLRWWCVACGGIFTPAQAAGKSPVEETKLADSELGADDGAER